MQAGLLGVFDWEVFCALGFKYRFWVYGLSLVFYAAVACLGYWLWTSCRVFFASLEAFSFSEDGVLICDYKYLDRKSFKLVL